MIHVGDCIEVMRTLEANSVDAVVTDPPYHLTNRGGPSGKGADNAYSRSRAGAASTGFMGKAWDGGDVAHRVETWAEALRVAKPGAWLLAFGGTRTFHRLACAIEDAGWELRDSVLRGHTPEDCPWLAGWLYGSGFPKSHNGDWGGTALKPAWEPIVMARKPLIGTVAANHAEHGTGGLNIDECRIETSDSLGGGAYSENGNRSISPSLSPTGMNRAGATAGGFKQPPGRWPANLVHDGSDGVVAVFPREAGASAPVLGTEPSNSTRNAYGDYARAGGAFHGDTGSTARFFYCAKADRADRNDGCEGLPKRTSGMVSNTSGQHITRLDGGAPPPSENHHPTVKPTDLMRYLCRLVTPRGGLVLDPFCGSGSTGRGAIAEGFRFVGIELDPDYARIAEARIRAIQPGLGL